MPVALLLAGYLARGSLTFWAQLLVVILEGGMGEAKQGPGAGTLSCPESYLNVQPQCERVVTPSGT